MEWKTQRDRWFLLAVSFLLKATLCSTDDDYYDDYSEEDLEIGLRSGFEMFTQRFPEPFIMMSEGLGSNVSRGFIRGTYTTSTTSSAVFELYGSQSAATGAGYGNWIGPPTSDGSPGNISVHEDGEQEVKKPQGDANMQVLLTQLWVSAILRDNIVTTFGYVLNRPQRPLSVELYSSLYIIYNFIRLRRINTLNLISVLNQMSHSPPQEQFLILFEELHRRIPEYLKSSTAVWVEALSKNQINLDVIIRPNGGPSAVDFLASLDSTVLDLLEEQIVFDSETIEQASKSIEVLMGPTFSYIFSAIYNGVIQLTQPLFAVILLHLPLDSIVPQKDEMERYIVDALRLNSIENWDSIIGRIETIHAKDPLKLVRAVLESIVDEQETDMQIKQDAIFLLPYVKPITPTFANSYYLVMSEAIGQPGIKFKTLLRHITVLEYPEEVVQLKDRLMYYINQGYIDMDLVAAGFIRYDYISPKDLLLAMLTRIRHRLPNLSDEILSTVKALQQFLVFKRIVASMSPVISSGFIYVPSLLDVFGNPSLPPKVRELQKTISGIIIKENIDWSSLFESIPIEECSTPKQCVITLIRKAIKEKLLVNSSALVYIERLLLLVDNMGNVKKSDVALVCNGTIGPISPEETYVETTSIQPPRRTRPPLTPITIMPTPTTTEFSVPFYEVPINLIEPTVPINLFEPISRVNVSVPSSLSNATFPPCNINMFFTSINFDQREQLLPPTIPFSSEDILLKPIREFIVRDDLLKILGPDFEPEKYTTKISLLRAILERTLLVEEVKASPGFHALVKRYLEFLVNQTESFQPTINYGALLDALPIAKTEEEFHYFSILKSFVANKEVDRYVGRFDMMRYHTRGLLLQNLFQYLLKLNEIQSKVELYRALNYYIDKIYFNGFGAQPIQYTLVKQEVVRRTVDLQSTFEAIDFDNLDVTGKRALRGVYRFFSKEFQPPIHLSNFEFMQYNTKGEWLKAFFDHLIRHPAVSEPAKRDFAIIEAYILLTGPGMEPVERNV